MAVTGWSRWTTISAADVDGRANHQSTGPDGSGLGHEALGSDSGGSERALVLGWRDAGCDAVARRTYVGTCRVLAMINRILSVSITPPEGKGALLFTYCPDGRPRLMEARAAHTPPRLHERQGGYIEPAKLASTAAAATKAETSCPKDASHCPSSISTPISSAASGPPAEELLSRGTHSLQQRSCASADRRRLRRHERVRSPPTPCANSRQVTRTSKKLCCTAEVLQVGPRLLQAVPHSASASRAQLGLTTTVGILPWRRRFWKAGGRAGLPGVAPALRDARRLCRDGCHLGSPVCCATLALWQVPYSTLTEYLQRNQVRDLPKYCIRHSCTVPFTVPSSESASIHQPNDGWPPGRVLTHL